MTITEQIEEKMDLFKKYLNRTNLDHKDYQYEGVKWCLTNELRSDPPCEVRGGFLADEMGLGKTIMMIGTFLTNFVKRTLVIVPPVLLDQWYLQIYKTTGHKALIYHGENKKTTTLDQLKRATLVISTYGAITLTRKQIKEGDRTMLHKVRWSRVVFDEAHHLRNAKTAQYISAKLMRSKITWLVSGTPIQNRKHDFYSLCSMLKLPASYYTETANLRQLAAAFILKRTKKQVGIQIPSMVVNKNIVDWTNQTEMELSEEIHSALAFSRVSDTKSNKCVVSSVKNKGMLALILRARQSCILPKLISMSLFRRMFAEDSFYKEAFNCSSKMDYVVKQIMERKSNGCGKLIFCHFREEIDEIAQRLQAGGIKVATFDGRTSSAKRAEMLNGNNEVLILQIQTGCEGLNLQENYSEIYFISPHWNPAVEDQAVARCHRIGQTKTVLVQRFEMCSFMRDKDQQIDTRSIDNYVGGVQDFKRIIASEFIKVDP